MPHYRIFLPGVLILLASTGIYAQRGGNNIHDHLLIKEVDRIVQGRPQEEYEGSPFLNDDYVVGKVVMGGDKSFSVTMRYDIFNDRMEFLERDQLFVLQPDPRITRIEIGPRVFLVRKFKHQAKSEYGFLELVETGKAKLFAKRLVNYRAKLDTHQLPAKYYAVPDNYYIQVDDLPLFRVTSIKNTISQLPEKQSEAAAFARQEKISTNDRGDLTKFVAYYNSLYVSP